jgi:hypothetical protein
VSLGGIQGEQGEDEDCQCRHSEFTGHRCLHWRMDWGNVPKDLTEAAETKAKAKKKAAAQK